MGTTLKNLSRDIIKHYRILRVPHRVGYKSERRSVFPRSVLYIKQILGKIYNILRNIGKLNFFIEKRQFKISHSKLTGEVEPLVPEVIVLKNILAKMSLKRLSCNSMD